MLLNEKTFHPEIENTPSENSQMAKDTDDEKKGLLEVV